MKHVYNKEKTRLIIFKLLLKGDVSWTQIAPENRLLLVAYLGNYDSFSVLVLRKVRENSWNRSTFSLLVEKPNYKNPRSFPYRFERAKFVLILKCNTVPCRIFRGISF